MGSHVFISYSHKDAEYVAGLKMHLVGDSFEVWTDEGIAPGVRWARTIDEQVRTCAVFIPVMSPHSRESEWVANEVLLAQRLSKAIFPLLLDGEPFTELLSTQYEDVTGNRMPSTRYMQQIRLRTEPVAEAERVEAERLEAERLEAERLEAERLEAGVDPL